MLVYTVYTINTSRFLAALSILYITLYVCAPLAGKNGFADCLEEINNQSINH